MKRFFAIAVIFGYLGSLCFGLFAHTLSKGAASHPAMYYLVWDMFCGWGSYSARVHFVAEGASGTFYELTPTPWGDFTPYGSVARRNYDRLGVYMPRFAQNILRHTKHEPIAQVFVVEELWPKKYNIRDDVWARLHGGPKDQQTYYNLWAVLDGDGNPNEVYPNWYSKQAIYTISNNPRLHAEASRSRSFFSNLSKPWTPGGTIRPKAFVPPALAGATSKMAPVDGQPTNLPSGGDGLPPQHEITLPEQTDIRSPLGN